jgi:hypothetical protein
MDNRNRSTKRNIQARLGQDERGDARVRAGQPRSTHARNKPQLPEHVLDEADSTSLKMHTAGYDVIHKNTGNKLGTVYQPTASRSSHVAVVHGPKGGPERKEFSSSKEAHNHIKKTYGLDEGMMDTVKTVAKKVGKALTGGSDEDQLKNLQKKMGVPQTGKKPTSK